MIPTRDGPTEVLAGVDGQVELSDIKLPQARRESYSTEWYNKK